MVNRSGFPSVVCVVEGCQRYTTTIRPIGEGFYDVETGTKELQYVCPGHWPRVPRLLKRRRNLLFKQWRRLHERYGVGSFFQLRPGSPERIRLVRSERLVRATWRRCVRIAAGLDEPRGDDKLPAGLSEELRRLGL